jgi:hypothetical protein
MKEFETIINEIIQFLLFPEFTGWLLVIKTIFIFFGLFFLGFTVWALFNTSWLKRILLWDLKEILTYRPYGIKKFKKEWKKIKERLEAGLESEIKLAVIEADSLVDKTLKNLGYTGESFGEKLDKLTPDILPNLEELREIHKIRNDIIHDPTYKLSQEEAKKALVVYEKSLIELDAL